LRYGEQFEARLMDLRIQLPLEAALNEGWRVLAECFEPAQTGLPSALVAKYWPQV
jgi:V/A-type H+-transporting ATPase subunit B